LQSHTIGSLPKERFLYAEQAQYHAVHGVDTRRHSKRFRPFLLNTGVYISVGASVTTPM
ncbi:MAG: hypothetical protein ACI944_001976, partial [Natronomonas sp.]